MANLLDTNVLSQLTKSRPDADVMHWLRSTDAGHNFLSVVSITEIRFGVQEMSRGRRRDDHETWLTGDLPRMFEGRILPVSEGVADMAGRLISYTKRKGAEAGFADALIGATAIVHRLDMVTINRMHFDPFVPLGLRLIEL